MSENDVMEFWNPELRFYDPQGEYSPPFNEPIIAVIGSSLDRGRGFKPHYEFVTLKVMQEDIDGDEDEGEEMAAELESGEAKWSDLQFRLEPNGIDVDELNYYSDSIVWWAPMPRQIPDPRRGGKK